MVHSLLSHSTAVANDRTMIKPKPSLPATANNNNLSSDNTLDYIGFWQQKALLHFTNSAYKGTFFWPQWLVISASSNIDQLTSYLYNLAHIFWFVIFQSSNLLVPRSLSFRVSWRLMLRRCFTWDMRVCAYTITALPWSIANDLTVLTAIELPHDFSCMICKS